MAAVVLILSTEGALTVIHALEISSPRLSLGGRRPTTLLSRTSAATAVKDKETKVQFKPVSSAQQTVALDPLSKVCTNNSDTCVN